MSERNGAFGHQELAREQFGEPADFLATFVSGSIVSFHELRQEINTAQLTATKTWRLTKALDQLSWSQYLLNSYFVPLHEKDEIYGLSNGRSVAAVEAARSAAQQAVTVARTTGRDTFQNEAYWRVQARRICTESSSLHPVVLLEEKVMSVRRGDDIDPQELTHSFQEVVWSSPNNSERLALYAWWITEAGLKLKSRELVRYGWGLVQHFTENTGQFPSKTYLLEKGIMNLVIPQILRATYRGNEAHLLAKIPGSPGL